MERPIRITLQILNQVQDDRKKFKMTTPFIPYTLPVIPNLIRNLILQSWIKFRMTSITTSSIHYYHSVFTTRHSELDSESHIIDPESSSGWQWQFRMTVQFRMTYIVKLYILLFKNKVNFFIINIGYCFSTFF